MRNIFILFLALATFACSNLTEKEAGLIGAWDAKWETFEESYPDVKNVASFTMDGKWTFNDDGTMTVEAYGFEGCIFGEDTLAHTQKWSVKSDTLNLINEEQIHGMTYTIVNMENNKVKLQLMSDIFVHLAK